METPSQNPDRTALKDRFRKSWLPVAAAVGAFTGFVSASLQLRPEPKPAAGGTPHPTEGTLQVQSNSLPALNYEIQYTKSAIIGLPGSLHPFQRSLVGVAVGPKDEIYGLGDDEIRVFDLNGAYLRSWRVLPEASCFTVTADGRLYAGAPGKIELYDQAGNKSGGFLVGDAKRPAIITAIKVFKNEILAADADARYIRRFDQSGNPLGLIGVRNNTGNFMLPNRWLDFDVDSKGVIVATDTGRHLVVA
jgi:hypothetical protein